MAPHLPCRHEPVSEQRALLGLLIQSVTPRRVSHGKYTAQITWTPIGQAIRKAAACAA
jgi:hypothetical protein